MFWFIWTFTPTAVIYSDRSRTENNWIHLTSEVGVSLFLLSLCFLFASFSFVSEFAACNVKSLVVNQPVGPPHRSPLSPHCPCRRQTLGASWLISSVSLPASPPVVAHQLLLLFKTLMCLVITSLSPPSPLPSLLPFTSGRCFTLTGLLGIYSQLLINSLQPSKM